MTHSLISRISHQPYRRIPGCVPEICALSRPPTCLLKMRDTAPWRAAVKPFAPAKAGVRGKRANRGLEFGAFFL